MQMVVDSNQLQNPQLRAFLEASTANRAILTDYAAMEALQGNAVKSMVNAMSIVGDYPDQIIVLKTTQSICQLSGEADGLQRRLIDTSQTSGFAEYIRKLKVAESGYQPMVDELLKMARDATEQLNRMLLDAAEVAPIFGDLSAGFNKEERRIIRDNAPLTMTMVDTLIKSVIDVSCEIFRTHPNAPHKVTYEQLPNTFIFRNSLCCCLLALEWTAIGGAKDAQRHKIRNDMIDSHFVTYATYFDGLLSDDAKALRMYSRAKEVLERAFG
ncbi:hypothetical protein HBO38_12070 [Pseudomonas veronii]|uniref:Uncharacterized protein n=1 Tax=Pseudomonas veronii TaxID=76761 RepID=A0A7Y1A4W0_PSEVE|nr:hypothetical protein [Pseudomonas veronii]NMY09170.1 hypothetical protein [Pseudomonas veronii]